ncbi:hypothetical protein PWT90_11069 [Aphanocladium album]|nr:hypothetical protein PWT90_11069 [Aphanocladium album]
MTGKTVVVLGGSIGGLGVAHRLLKYTLPSEPNLKVILVSTNSHFYWNVAAVRAIIPNILQDEELLQPIAPGFAQYNTPQLASMGVVVRKGVRAVSTEATADGRTEVALSNGETLVTDLYLPTVGMVPNSECVPGELLDDKKLVKTDECMRVPGADNVWAVGDVVGKPNAGYLMTEAQASCVAKNIACVLSGKKQEPRGAVMDILIFATGRCRGVGRYHWMPLPSLAVWVAKSRTLGVERTPKFVDGSMW